MHYRRNKRPALTLLEMVLTFAIAMVVLLALFMIMQTQYTHAQAGRDVIEEAGLARSILTRIAADISGSLGPVDPRFLPNGILPNNANATPTGGMAAVAAASAAAATTPTASPTTGTTTPSSTTNASSTASSSTGMTPAPYNLGVMGDAKWLVLSVNRVPAALIASPKASVTDNSIISSDLRSVSIWLVDGMGLARNEMGTVTSDTAPTGQPNFDNPQQYVFASEVMDITFTYFDGINWQTSWDGGQLGGNDGNTPIGPPLAIRIQLTLRRGPAPRPGDDPNAADTAKYVHVVTLPASNGFTQALQSGSGAQTSGQSLVPALQAGQPIPAANSQSTGTGSGM